MLGIDFKSEPSNVDEQFRDRPTNPRELTALLAKMKAESIAARHSATMIFGFDSVGYHNGCILEKPKSREEAFNRLKTLSESSYDFYTGIYIITDAEVENHSIVVMTTVFMRKLLEWEINKYLNQDSNVFSYALGFDPLGYYSSTFINRITGSYNNILYGIPLEEIVKFLPKISSHRSPLG
jgi:septum formation protein